MTDFIFIASNLLINSLFSFWGALLIVLLGLKIFSFKSSRWELYIYFLPFFKVILDLLRGIPANSVLVKGSGFFTTLLQATNNKGANILHGGFDISTFGPVFLFVLKLRGPEGHQYSSSVGDLFLRFVVMHDLLISFTCILCLIGCVSIWKLYNLLHLNYEFRKKVKASVSSESGTIEFKDVFHLSRRCKIYILPSDLKVPFTSGICKPYVCIPKSLYNELSHDEMTAIIQHELAHIKYYDLVVYNLLLLLSVIFWFIPGISILKNKITTAIENQADIATVRTGTEPIELASMLIKIKKRISNTNVESCCLPFYRASVLKYRISQLLKKDLTVKASIWRNLGRCLFVIWITGTVYWTNFGQNYTPQNRFSLLRPIIQYFLDDSISRKLIPKEAYPTDKQ